MQRKMHPTIFPFLFVFLTIVQTPSYTKTIYVGDDSTGVNDGSSWANAYNYLQDALADANSSEKPVEIRVARGIYKPDQGANQIAGDRTATFQLINGVTLKGGYAGTGADDPNTRDVKTYRTVLTGDLKDNDLPPIGKYGNFTSGPIGHSRRDNSLRVVTVLEEEDEVVLDGFTITGAKCILGSKPSRHPIGYGGGLYSYESHLIVRNCTFEFNLAASQGGAIYIEGGEYIIENCVFNRNYAMGELLGEGGAIACSRSHLTIDNSSLIANVSVALFAMNCDRLDVSNCLFAGNVSYGQGAAISSVGSTLQLTQCNLVSNGPGSALFVGSLEEHIGKVEITGCIFSNDVVAEIFINQGIIAKFSYSNISVSKILYPVIWGNGNIDVDPCFADPGYWDPNGTSDEQDDFWVDGDYHLKSQAGRWEPTTQAWTMDDVTSLCIDAGDPNSPIGHEPFPNGGRINMGAYGGTAEASKSYFGKPTCETIVAGDINGDCMVNFADFAIMVSHWLQDNSLNL